MKTNFNVLYKVNTLLYTNHIYVDLFKDKKEFYLQITFPYTIIKNQLSNHKSEIFFFKISRYDLINLLREKIKIPFIIEKAFDNEDGIFSVIDNNKELSITNLKKLDWSEIKEYLDVLEDNYNFYVYALHLEKRLNGKLRKEKIKNLFNE